MARLKVDVSVQVTHSRPEWVWDVRLMLNCDRTSFWWVSGWLNYVAESANVESPWLIFIYIFFKSIAQHLAERVEDVESCSNSDWISGRTKAWFKLQRIYLWLLLRLHERWVAFSGIFWCWPVDFYRLQPGISRTCRHGALKTQITEQQSSACRQCERNHFTSYLPLPDNSTVREAAMGRLWLTLADILPSH